MEEKEVKKLRDAVIQGLQDGRSLESLKNAMHESGYSDAEISQVVSGIDTKRIVRKPPKKKYPMTTIFFIALFVIILVAGYVLFVQPITENKAANSKKTEADVSNTSKPANMSASTGPKLPEVPANATRICYASNESIKDVMIQAGAKCDKWFIVKEF